AVAPGGVSHFFFFSSRRRHTRFSRDWSSDVCSSDLAAPTAAPPPRAAVSRGGGDQSGVADEAVERPVDPPARRGSARLRRVPLPQELRTPAASGTVSGARQRGQPVPALRQRTARQLGARARGCAALAF